MSELNKLHKQILKDKKGKSKQALVFESEESDDDTEQIEAKIAARNRWWILTLYEIMLLLYHEW